MKDWIAHLPRGTSPDSVDLLAEGTLPRAWARRWAGDPGRPVVHTESSGWHTAGDLDAASRRVAARLHHAGLRSGDRILMSAAPSLELVVAHVAALRLGLAVVPANTAYRERELSRIIDDAEPAAAVLDEPERVADLGVAVVLSPAVELPDGPPVELDTAAMDDPAVLAYTSGTTGAPKGAVLSHANLLASSESVRIAWRWTEHDRLVLALPLFHIHGLGVGLHGTLLTGGSAILLAGFDVDGVLDAAVRHQATLFFGVPTMYARLAASPRVGELARLRLCVSGSAPLPPAVLERIEAAGGPRVLERYGMTETGMNTSNPYAGERRPGTVGLPLPGMEVRLDPGPPGQGPRPAGAGEILLRGPGVFSGYWHAPEATAAAFCDEHGRPAGPRDGWFRTGDIGEFDEAGYLRIAGRAKELIITGGLNVHPREVEEVLLTHAAVAEVAVTGTPDEEWGEIVTAWVVPDGDPPEPGELMDHAAARLADFKRPRRIHFVASLPRNALGKLVRHEIGRTPPP